MEYIDEFLAGLSKDELDYIADKAELLLKEQMNKAEGEVKMSDFEEED